MDDLARYNQERWEALAQANVQYSRPVLDLDRQSARAMVDEEELLGQVAGKDVLCLAGGGGQQSAAFGLLGARVTVLDLTETQLERDRQTAAHYNLAITTVQGDMRDLSHFADDAFDLVWHAHSLNFVPEPGRVFAEVARVLRQGGLYRLHCSNPFTHSVDDSHWDERGYALKEPYVDGEIILDDPHWEFEDTEGAPRRVEGPREFRHTLNTLVTGLIEQDFIMLGIWEDRSGDPEAEPGSWDHFKAIAPPWLTFWAAYRPDLMAQIKPAQKQI